MKIALELISNDNGVQYLNFWNWMNGDDVVTEIINDELFITEYDEQGNASAPRKIEFPEFLRMVKERVDQWPS